MDSAELAGWLLGLGYAYQDTRAKTPILSDEDEAFLADQARRICDSAKLKPGQTVQGWRNATPYTLHVPGGNLGYHAYWTRDSVMMLESGLIQAQELEDWIRLNASVVRGRDWHLRPGAVIPAFSIPDHINLDGQGSFYPGNYETGTKQGGNPFGKYPPLDDNFYFITAVYHHWKLTGSAALWKSRLKTFSSSMQLADLCERVYRMVPCDATTGLCMAGDVQTENAKDFGFCDGESKSGKLLFTSILKFVAARQLAEIYSATGSPLKAAAFRRDASKIKTAIPPTFLHPTTLANEAWLDSATEVCKQPDIWGSAYAVYCDAVDETTSAKISRALVRAYREKTAVRNGCVSHLLSNDPKNPKGWQKTILPWGVYQNGGYWGTAVGWYLVAMRKTDAAAAAGMAQDYMEFLRKNRNPDGTSYAWEWFNPDTGKNSNPLYAATVVLPYGCLRAAGLLKRQ